MKKNSFDLEVMNMTHKSEVSIVSKYEEFLTELMNRLSQPLMSAKTGLKKNRRKCRSKGLL